MIKVRQCARCKSLKEQDPFVVPLQYIYIYLRIYLFLSIGIIIAII